MQCWTHWPASGCAISTRRLRQRRSGVRCAPLQPNIGREAMQRSTDRILTTHVGSLVRPPGLVELMRAKENGQPYDQQELAARVRSSVKDVVQKQIEVGVDIISDGEYGKPSFSGYVNERLS